MQALPNDWIPDTVIAEVEAMVADAFGLDGSGGASGTG